MPVIKIRGAYLQEVDVDKAKFKDEYTDGNYLFGYDIDQGYYEFVPNSTEETSADETGIITSSMFSYNGYGGSSLNRVLDSKYYNINPEFEHITVLNGMLKRINMKNKP